MQPVGAAAARQLAGQALERLHGFAGFAAPGRQNQHMHSAQAACQVGQQVERSRVGPVQVIQEQHARHWPGQQHLHHLPQRLEEARLCPIVGGEGWARVSPGRRLR